jgi:hypothetical protein
MGCTSSTKAAGPTPRAAQSLSIPALCQPQGRGQFPGTQGPQGEMPVLLTSKPATKLVPAKAALRVPPSSTSLGAFDDVGAELSDNSVEYHHAESMQGGVPGRSLPKFVSFGAVREHSAPIGNASEGLTSRTVVPRLPSSIQPVEVAETITVSRARGRLSTAAREAIARRNTGLEWLYCCY